MAMKPTEEIMMMGKRADVPMGNPNAKKEAPREAMEAMAALMGNEAMLGSSMDRPMPADSGTAMQQDAGALAEAVVGRTGGDVQQALMLLDDAKAMLEAASREPIRAADGRTMSDEDMEEGRTKSDKDMEEGRTMSDRDMREGRTMSDRDLKPIPEGSKGAGLRKLPEDVRNNMGFMADGGGIMNTEEYRRKRDEYLS